MFSDMSLFNKEYLYLTQLLEVSGVDCITSAKSLRENNEKLIIKRLLDFPTVINESANNYNPSIIAHYIYNFKYTISKNKVS